MPARPTGYDATATPLLLMALLLVMRVLWLAAYPLDSDEPQHAHVAWSLAQGLLPYRDVAPKKVKLPKRKPELRKGYARPPLDSQNFVPQIY